MPAVPTICRILATRSIGLPTKQQRGDCWTASKLMMQMTFKWMVLITLKVMVLISCNYKASWGCRV